MTFARSQAAQVRACGYSGLAKMVIDEDRRLLLCVTFLAVLIFLPAALAPAIPMDRDA